MDLVSTIRKQGSRGGVNFNWDDVATSAHRENYLGHSLKAPVGRWQQGKDLGWYAKGDDPNIDPNETDEQRQARIRREEIQKIKEAEEDAMAKALGLPPPVRNQSGANAIEVTGSRVGGDTEAEAVPGGLQIKKEEKEEKYRSWRREGREGRDREHRHRHRHRSRSRIREGHTDRRVRDRAAEDESQSRRHDGRHRSRSPRGEDRHRRHMRPEEPRSRSRDYRRRSRSRDRARGQNRYRRSSDGRRSASLEDRRRSKYS